MDQEKKVPPVPTGSMYIGVCTSRAQAIAQRWQATMAFIAINTTLGNIIFGTFNPESARKMFAASFIFLIATGFNAQWYQMFRRSNKWIEFYSKQLRAIEVTSSTESGVRIFSDFEIPSEKIGKMEIRTSQGILYISQWVLMFSVAAVFITLGYAIYLSGSGK
jgi:hypothetical protein